MSAANAGTPSANHHRKHRQYASGRGDFAAPLPMRVGVGLGVSMSRLRIELNSTVFFPQSAAFESSYTSTRQSAQNGPGATVDAFDSYVVERSNAVIDSSVGAEFQLSKSISVLSGLATAFDGPFEAQARRARVAVAADDHELLPGEQVGQGVRVDVTDRAADVQPHVGEHRRRDLGVERAHPLLDILVLRATQRAGACPDSMRRD